MVMSSTDASSVREGGLGERRAALTIARTAM